VGDSPAYRPDIDGLRAVAILAVLTVHTVPNTLQGGFVGVDIFFVISGYLISGRILRDLEAGGRVLPGFYARRVRRLFPALVPVLIGCLVIGSYLLFPDEYRQLGKHVVASSLFVENIRLLGEQGYFDKASTLKPLLHLWSLAIEEQFYIFYPLLLVWAHRRKHSILLTIVLATLLSFILNIGITSTRPDASFYFPLTRGWELTAGAILACMEGRIRRGIPGGLLAASTSRAVVSGPRWLGHLQSVLGMALIAAAITLFKPTFRFPGWWACIPILGAMLVIRAGVGSVVNRVLSATPLVFIGLISYPLYLWHWPLLSFAYIAEGQPANGVRLGLALVSVVLATLTYSLVEKPIRQSRWRGVTVGLGGGLIGVAAVGLLVGARLIAPLGHGSQAEAIAAAAGEWDYPGALSPQTLRGRTVYTVGGKGHQTLFFGDSNMEQYATRIQSLLSKEQGNGRGAIFLTGAACPPIPEAHEQAHPDCENLVTDFLSLAQDERVDRIVIAAQWYYLFLPQCGLQPNAPCFTFGDRRDPIEQETGAREATDEFRRMIQRLMTLQRRVYVVLSSPAGVALDPAHSVIRRSLLRGVRFSTHRSVARFAIEQYTPYANFIAAVRDTGAQIIDPMDFLCHGNRCPALSERGEAMYKDDCHLRPSYARTSVLFLDDTVAE
jgi:peptidoglycan/LPS O-acetylase OafA/YrhL